MNSVAAASAMAAIRALLISASSQCLSQCGASPGLCVISERQFSWDLLLDWRVEHNVGGGNNLGVMNAARVSDVACEARGRLHGTVFLNS